MAECMSQKTRLSENAEAAPVNFDRQMDVMRQVMDREWVVLRALAIGDEYPDLDVEARLEMARKEAAARGKPLGRNSR